MTTVQTTLTTALRRQSRNTCTRARTSTASTARITSVCAARTSSSTSSASLVAPAHGPRSPHRTAGPNVHAGV